MPFSPTRTWRWWIVAAALLLAIAIVAPAQLGVLLLKFGQQVLAALVGYQLSKVTLIHAVPEPMREVPVVSAALTVGRALVMLGAMLAVGLGL
ncbi:hypothetical protein MBSD_n1589 [Mizugakiibacter sediminis]|nr:putative holin [Mizugakiibacter sediminis]GAP66285.1 hypothetical protein MBSD_n1589 [Mizugakiibacter sediminis]